jgi:type I restriction enzyme S subunit
VVQKCQEQIWNVVENGFFSIPLLLEHQKIASFLSLIDERIQTQNKIIEQLKSLIDGLSEKLFTQKLKFKDEKDNAFSGWEVKKLQEVLSKYEEKTTSNNQYPILTSARTGIHFQKDYFNDNEVASKNNTGYNIVPKGYFTYRHMSDDITFKFNINTICEKGIVSTLYPVFTTVGLDDYFFKTYLNKGQEFKNYALMQKQGGSRTYMYFTKLIQLELTFPCLEEQTKIASFLSQIDEKIEIEKQLLVQYENQKKYLLQNLFV